MSTMFEETTGGNLFLDAPIGTGKTFIPKVHRNEHIAYAMESSGIDFNTARQWQSSPFNF